MHRNPPDDSGILPGDSGGFSELDLRFSSGETRNYPEDTGTIPEDFRKIPEKPGTSRNIPVDSGAIPVFSGVLFSNLDPRAFGLPIREKPRDPGIEVDQPHSSGILSSR